MDDLFAEVELCTVQCKGTRLRLSYAEYEKSAVVIVSCAILLALFGILGKLRDNVGEEIY